MAKIDRVLRNLRQSIPTGIVMGRRSPGDGPAEFIPLSDIQQSLLDAISDTQGSILYRGATAWAALAPGVSGQALLTQGAGANPVWGSAGGGSDPFFSPPLAADFPTLLTNGVGPITENEFADVTDQGLAFRATLRNSTPTSILRVKSAPTAPWTITTRFTFQYPAKKIVLCGFALRDSADNEMEWFGVFTDSISTAPQLRIYRVTTTTVNSVPLTKNPALLFGHIYLRASLDGAGNLVYSTSSDGHNFEVALSTTLGAFIDAVDQVGFFIAKFSGGGNNDTYSMMMSYYNEA